MSPTAVGRLICVALTSLSSTCTAYEALLVHLPTTLSGSWTLACVFVVSIVFTVCGVAYERRESAKGGDGGDAGKAYRPRHYLAFTLQATLSFVAIFFDYLGVTYAPVGDAVALYSLSAVWTPLLETVIKRQRPSKQVEGGGDGGREGGRE